VGILTAYGVHIQFEPLTKKTWLLTLSLEYKAGNGETLRALQDYVRHLVETFGAPDYMGPNRYKGEAFQRFSRVDMRGLARV